MNIDDANSVNNTYRNEKFRVSAASLKQTQRNYTAQQCSNRIKQLAKNTSSLDYSAVDNPMEYCNDFRGLLLADYFPALSKCYTDEKVQEMRRSVDKFSQPCGD